MPSPVKASPKSSRADFTQAAKGVTTAAAKNPAQHQPQAIPAPQPRGMGESTVNRSVHYKKQAQTALIAKPRNSKQNNTVKEKRAVKAFEMVASKDGVIRGENSKER